MKTKIFVLIAFIYAITGFSQYLPSGYKYVYQEEFNSVGTWPTGNTSVRSLEISGGKYYYQHKKKDKSYTLYTRSITLDHSRDFELITSIQKISGVKDYGICFLFDYLDTDNFQEFSYTANGYYRVASSTGGTWKAKKGWTKNDKIKTGNYATNVLKVRKTGSRVYFYMNSNLLYDTSYESFKGKKMAIRLWRNQKVAINYIRASERKSTTTNNNSNTSKTIMFEGFNSNDNNWPTTYSNDADVYVANGNLTINHKNKSGAWGPTIYKYINTTKDFSITARFKKVDGIQNNGYGIIFGQKDQENRNRFLITGGGSYLISKKEIDNQTYLRNWTKSSAIKKGNGQFNTLKVVKSNGTLKYYINSTLVYTNYSPKFYGNRIGFFVNQKQRIDVAYLELKYINQVSNNNNSYTNKDIHDIKESIFFDGYTDNKNNWSVSNNENVELDISNGDYYFDHRRDNGGWSSTIIKYINTSRDFKIVADIKKISGIQNNGYGIVFGRKDSQNQNLFYVNGQGSYSINKIRNGQDNFLKKWTASSAIRTGNGKYNVLKVVKVGSKLEYYINNTKVYTDYSPQFFGDRVGYIVYNRQKVSVAYLSIGYLDKKSNTNNNNNNSYTNNTTGKSILFEGFNNNNNKWNSSDKSEADVFVSGGNLTINHKRSSGGWAPTIYKYVNSSRDFSIEAQFKKISGVQNNGFGLVFGRKDNDNENKFFISAGGSYIVNYEENGQRKYLKNWTKSSAIRKGNYSQNTLKVTKVGNTMKYYINGTLVYTSYTTKYFGNRVGFIVYDLQKIEVAYLSMRYLDNKEDEDTIRNYTYSDSGFHFSDQFNDNSNDWYIVNDNVKTFSVSNGKYYIDHKRDTKGWSANITKTIDDSRNFEIETKIDKISGVNNYGYGLMFGKNDTGEFRFYIASTGYFKVVRIVNDEEQLIQKWIKSSYVKTGNGKSNVLKVKKDNDYYKFYINGNFVFQTEFEPFYGNQIGYVVYNKQKIGVDYLRVKYNTSSNTNNYTNNKVLKLPLVENFYSNNNGWYTGDFDNYSTKLNGGRLTIDRKKKGGVFVSRDVDIDTQKDFVIETSISTPLSDASGLYGITFGRKNSSNEYSFLISTSGSYLYRKFDNDNYTKIIPFTSNDAIRTGAGSTNTIKIEKHGNLIRFYINGQYMNEAPFQPFFGNKFGYTVYFKQKIVVDSLNIKYQTKSSYNDPPVVVITEPTVELKRGFKIVETKRITVRGKAIDPDGIFEIMVNGVEANVSEDGSFVASVPLKYGKNDLVVKATDIKEATSTKTFTIKRKSPEVDEVIVENKNETKIDIGFGKYHALIIGVSEYDDESVVDLSGEPTKDAQALVNVLTTMYGFDKVNVKVLKNPTRNEITRSFFDLRKKVSKNDNLLIFYAGHGNYDESSERGYWMPANVNMEYEENILLNTELVSYIKSINSKHTLLIADACFSGSIFNSRSYTKEEKSAQRKYSLTSRKAITSGTLKTVPNKSVFIQYLLKKLKENQSKYLPTSKLFSMIEEPVLNNSENIPQRGVIHGTGDEGGDFIFIKQ